MPTLSAEEGPPDATMPVVVVRHEGQLNAANRQEFRRHVLDALECGGRRFWFDFSDVGYIDSSALGVLVSLSRRIRAAGGKLQLAHLNAEILTVFKLTKLDSLFEIVDARDGVGPIAS